MKRNDWFVAMMVVFVGLGSLIVADNEVKLIIPQNSPKEILFSNARITTESFNAKVGEPLKVVFCIENPSKNTIELALPIDIYETRSYPMSRMVPMPELIHSKVYKLRIAPGKKEGLDLIIQDKLGLTEDSQQILTYEIKLKTSDNNSIRLAYFRLYKADLEKYPENSQWLKMQPESANDSNEVAVPASEEIRVLVNR